MATVRRLDQLDWNSCRFRWRSSIMIYWRRGFSGWQQGSGKISDPGLLLTKLLEHKYYNSPLCAIDRMLRRVSIFGKRRCRCVWFLVRFSTYSIVLASVYCSAHLSVALSLNLIVSKDLFQEICIVKSISCYRWRPFCIITRTVVVMLWTGHRVHPLTDFNNCWQFNIPQACASSRFRSFS